MLASVRISACTPAPPDGSVAAKVKTAGGALIKSVMRDEIGLENERIKERVKDQAGMFSAVL